ncbi:CRISPR-associated helicase Cas3' [Campylobacter concisus]|uniref:CRISPR-associated helicase Cas3' n=1 Tax=Campylobacter concisus TaxID=199 RepID=UPI0015E17AE1|nr:CRISPR-associated helicase Cas3' [Campylobacter concisus]
MMQISDVFNSHLQKSYNSHIKNIADSFDDDEQKEAASFHDLAKISQKFQDYINLDAKNFNSADEFEKARQKLKTTHTLESAFIYFFARANKDINFLANFFAILKHHSDLPDIDYFLSSIGSTKAKLIDRLKKIDEIAKRANLDIDIDIYDFVDYFLDLENELSKYYGLESFFIFKKRYSRLILADKFEAIFSESYQNLAVLNAKKIDHYIDRIKSLIATKKQDDYKDKAREIIFKNFNSIKDKKTFLIKAPTGIGKTFLALNLALEIARNGNKRRIITAIPFTSIIDQTHTEYQKIIADQDVLKYHHLTSYKSQNDDEQEQFMQKVFLADIWHENFIVTTFNQLFFTFFSNHNKDNLKLETLRDSVVIIDEIQNIPRVLLKSIAAAFNEFSKRYNIHFIVMSATMPHIAAELESFTELSEPILYKREKDRYEIIYEPNIKGLDDLVNEILKHQDESALCVVNTISKAKKLYEALKNSSKKGVYLLTTHQIPLHRVQIIDEIKEKLKSGEKITLVATQLIEAGVDLSFDVGFREFAPIGAIIQAAGRVNRNATSSKPAKVVVFDYIDGETFPYHDIDLQEEKVKEILSRSIKESEIYQILESYFQSTKDETTSIDLLGLAKELKFQTLFDKFNDNFMPKQDYKVSLFIEQYNGHFNEFLEKREALLVSGKDKFIILANIKELEKELALYTIAVGKNMLGDIKSYTREFFGRYILAPSDFYNKFDGFLPELTAADEVFD